MNSAQPSVKASGSKWYSLMLMMGISLFVTNFFKSFQGTYRGYSKKLEKICVARWDYAIHKSSFSELSYLAFSQNSLSNSPHFASLAIHILWFT